MADIRPVVPAWHGKVSLQRWARLLAARWRRARQLRMTRRYVMEMDARMLNDIGISRAQALFEIDAAVKRGE